jgi:hypothetical protein
MRIRTFSEAYQFNLGQPLRRWIGSLILKSAQSVKSVVRFYPRQLSPPSPPVEARGWVWWRMKPMAAGTNTSREIGRAHV